MGIGGTTREMLRSGNLLIGVLLKFTPLLGLSHDCYAVRSLGRRCGLLHCKCYGLCTCCQPLLPGYMGVGGVTGKLLRTSHILV